MKRVILTEHEAPISINLGPLLKLLLGLLIGLAIWFVWTHLNYGQFATFLPRNIQQLDYIWFGIVGVGISFIYIPIQGNLEFSFDASPKLAQEKRISVELIYPDGTTEKVHVSRVKE